MAGHRAVVVGLLIVMVAVCGVALWPESYVRPLAGEPRDEPAPLRSDAPAPMSSAIADTDTSPLERILVAEEERPPGAAEPRTTTTEEREGFARLIRDLLDDDVRWNATRALRQLDEPEAVPMLQEALDSRDLQQRQLAAVALTSFPVRNTPRLAEVLVESMHDDVENHLFRTLARSSARLATRHLYHHPENARPALRRALWAGDEQQRFLSAFLLGCDGSTADQPLIVRELVGRLADNDVSGDAMMAAHALYRLGPEVAPTLAGWRPHVDRQAQQLIDLVLLDLRSPPRTQAELAARQRMHGVTCLYRDPVVEFDVRRSRLATR